MRHMLIMLVGLAAVGMPASRTHAATTLFDTASGPIPGGSRLIVGDYNWPFHRFQITQPTNQATVGGYFGNSTGASRTIFAAIVALSDSADNPDSLNLTTPDLLATTLIPLGTATQTYESPLGPLGLNLAPGWYALQFGTGAFGASSATSLFDLGLPSHSVDLDPSQLDWVAIQSGHPSLAPGYVAIGSPQRFFATATIPEPHAASGVLIVLAILAGRNGRNGRSGTAGKQKGSLLISNEQ
jgi:hypothetical protein